MEAMPQKLLARSEKSAPAGIAIFTGKGKHVWDSGASPGFSMHEMEDCDDFSERAESVASECSEASDAQSVDRTNLDAAASDKVLQRCPSGGSIVTYDGASSGSRGKLREEGECERTRDKQPPLRLEYAPAQSESSGDQQKSLNEVQNVDQSGAPDWTEDKHFSFLNSIEQTFVNSMYGQDYRTVDGSDDQDCVESRPMHGSYRYGGELFTSLQRGCYDQREYYRPQFLHVPVPYSPAIFLSPWIQHFNPKATTPGHGVALGQDGGQGGAGTSSHIPSMPADANNGGDNVKEDVKEEVMESFPEFPEVAKGLQNRRHQGHHTDVNGGVQSKKRTGNGDPCSDGIYRPKKLKNTQRLLAAIDLEMEEQFVLKQKSIEEQAELSGWKANVTELQGGYRSGLDLNRPLDQTEEIGRLENASLNIQVVPTSASPVRPSQGPTDANTRAPGRSNPVIGGKQYLGQARDASGRQAEESMVSEKVKYVGDSTAGLSEKRKDGKENASGKTERELEEEADLELFPIRSPRASKTYTWGASGPRRRLQKDCNTAGDAI